MGKRMLAALLILAMVLTLFPAVVLASKNDSANSVENITSVTSTTVVPSGYTGIYTANDLNAVRNNLNGNYILMGDIDLSSWGEWRPIGDAYDSFSGVLDGNGYSILNMKVTDNSAYKYGGRDGQQYAGLFSIISSASIKNIRIITGTINCKNQPDLRAGAVCGQASASSIVGCGSSVNIFYQHGEPTGENVTWALGVAFRGGGIVGMAYDTIIERCFNQGKISAIGDEAPMKIGGIVGQYCNDFAQQNQNIDIQISNCYNSGTITAHTDFSGAEVGGIAGDYFTMTKSATIESCYNIGTLNCIAGTSAHIGGIQGQSATPSCVCTISNCYYVFGVSAVGYIAVNDRSEYKTKTTVDATALDYDSVLKLIIAAGFTLPSEPEPEEPFPDDNKTCRLGELTPLDYLAFSSLAYNAAPSQSQLGNITVKEMLGTKWNAFWESESIVYSEIFSHVSNWIVYNFEKNDDTGFAAYMFKNEYDEFVVAYRGSVSFSASNITDPDWSSNDIPMFLGENGTQVDQALRFAGKIVDRYGANSVAITGHSLGGALCDIVSARYSCYAQSFNAAPFLMNAYEYYPGEMGELFSGAEFWKFTDHVTKGDFVGELRLWIKNANIHDFIAGKETSTHSLASMIERDSSGNLKLTRHNTDRIGGAVSGSVLTSSYYFGTAGTNRFEKPDSFAPHTAYGGDSADVISTGKSNDIIVGGRGNDQLDGGHGHDKYYYFKGDGEDWIHDLSGLDALYLVGFDDSDVIEVATDSKYVSILCNGEAIVHVAKDRTNSIFKENVFCVWSNDKNLFVDLTPYLKQRSYLGRFVISCPVNVEIVDDLTGEIVQTLLDGEIGLGATYTDYGYFYVFQNEDGEYEKVADLFEGYSIRIIGVGDGIMDVTVYDSIDEEFSNPYKAIGVPVTSSTVGIIAEENGSKYLLLDTDGDGNVDERILLAMKYIIEFEANGGSGVMDAVIVEVGEELILPECGFVAPEGMEFRAWSINGIEYAAKDTYTPTGNVAAIALWKNSDTTIPSSPAESEPFEPSEPSKTPEAPETGDSNDTSIWFSLLIISVIGMFFSSVLIKIKAQSK